MTPSQIVTDGRDDNMSPLRLLGWQMSMNGVRRVEVGCVRMRTFLGCLLSTK